MIDPTVVVIFAFATPVLITFGLWSLWSMFKRIAG